MYMLKSFQLDMQNIDEDQYISALKVPISKDFVHCIYQYKMLNY